MLYNFTDDVRQALAAAREQAIRLKHDHVGPEHMLLGLLQKVDGMAATVLGGYVADLDEIGDAMREGVEPGNARVALGELPYTPEAKQVLEWAISEAVDFDHDYVGSEHLLLGLLGVEHSLACHVLATFDVTLDGGRRKVAAALGVDLPASKAARSGAEPTARRLGLEPLQVSIAPGDATAGDLAALHSAISAVYRTIGDEGQGLVEAQMTLADAIEGVQETGGNVLLRRIQASDTGQPIARR